MIKDLKIISQYDRVVARTIQNLCDNANLNNGVICLKGFNPKDENHLFVLHVAYLTKSVYHYKIATDLNFFSRTILNIKNYRHFDPVRYTKATGATPSVDELLEYMRPYNGGIKYSDIYREYYKGD